MHDQFYPVYRLSFGSPVTPLGRITHHQMYEHAICEKPETTMNKHRTHQIDDLAQRVFHNALPPTWVSNEHTNDYGKDFHVEIGDHNGDLTGNSFYVQLKGQERVVSTSDGHSVKYSLETKYAIYYLDQIKDLPVFLVMVDVEKKQG